MQCVVMRSFPGAGTRVYLPGEVVDASEWLHADKLIRLRYLRQATAEELAQAAPEEAHFEPPRAAKRGSRRR